MSSRILVKSLLGQFSFFMVNKSMIKEFGLNESALLSVLVDGEEHAIKSGTIKDNYFPCSLEHIEDKLHLGRKPIESAASNLRNAGLIEYKKIGCPPIKHYAINHNAIIEIISKDDSQFAQNGQIDLFQMDNLICPKRTTNKNNINKNNIFPSLGDKSPSPQGDEVKKGGRIDYKFEEYPEEWHPILQDWLDYKRKRKEKLGPVGLKTFYNFANSACEGDLEWVKASVKHTKDKFWQGFQPLSKREYDDKRTSGAISRTAVSEDRGDFPF